MDDSKLVEADTLPKSPEAAGAPSPEDNLESTKDVDKKKKGKNKKKKDNKTAAVEDESTVADDTLASPTESSRAKGASKFSPQTIDSLLKLNPSLKGELGSVDSKQAAEMLSKLDMSDLLTGMSIDGKNQKDMASYKFWQTQPVPRFDENADNRKPDGPIQIVDQEQVSKEPGPLLEGFEWCELDLTQEDEIKEVYELLTFHYVEDDRAMFRFNYSKSFLNWALKSPGWMKKLHVGVRASKSRKLVASIFGIPAQVKVRDVTLDAMEINFLCIHKKLRSKRLTPVLIKEITRRCYLEGIYQAIYTGAVILPKPIATCRYFHRPLSWHKLYQVGFSPLPRGSTVARMVAKNQVPTQTSLPGLRPMVAADIEPVRDLLHRYLSQFSLAQYLSAAEIAHWLLHTSVPTTSSSDSSNTTNESATPDAQTVWAYVVEAADTGKITDMVSFYSLESTVIRNEGKSDGSDRISAAYLFYYASEAAFADGEKGYKDRLNLLIGDALVEAKKVSFQSFHHPFALLLSFFSPSLCFSSFFPK
jgi:glycylpeptide N-tetradecanoyltransferase